MSSFSDEEVGRILANRQAARLRHDYKTADRLRDQLNEQCVSVDDKKNRWDASVILLLPGHIEQQHAICFV